MPARGYRFSDFDLKHIKEALKNGVSQADLARSYGVSQATMSRVINDNELKISDKPVTPLQRYLADFAAHVAELDLPDSTS